MNEAILSLSRFNSHFPGGPGLAGFTETKDDGSGGQDAFVGKVSEGDKIEWP